MKDQLKFNKPWEFDTAVTNVFEDMLQRSIPGYDLMREYTHHIIKRELEDKPFAHVLDIGTSKASAVMPFLDASEGRLAKFWLIDNSKAMIESIRHLEKDYDNVRVLKMDARNLPVGINILPPRINLVALAILTLIFVPIEFRSRIVAYVYANMQPGDKFIVVEKVRGSTEASASLLIEQYHAMKMRHGYTKEQVADKEASLIGQQVCNTSAGNIELLRNEGFRSVDVFFRALNFEGYIAIK